MLWQTLRQEFFEQALRRAEQAVDVAEEGFGVVDEFDRLVQGDALDGLPQRVRDQRAQRPGFFGVVDRADEAGADRLRQFLVGDPVFLFEAFAPLRRRQRPGQRLAGYPEFAGGAVEGGDGELVGDFTEALRVAPRSWFAGVLHLLRRVGG